MADFTPRLTIAWSNARLIAGRAVGSAWGSVTSGENCFLRYSSRCSTFRSPRPGFAATVSPETGLLSAALNSRGICWLVDALTKWFLETMQAHHLGIHTGYLNF